MQTYQQLQHELDFKYELPITPDWSAAADFLFLIKDYCLSEKPKTIVECSSGVTTLILSQCCKLNTFGHVYSLENAEQYQQQTLHNLARFKLQNYADVFHAPLTQQTINAVEYDWYQADAVNGLKIDMLVIDGPSGFIQKHSRLPALPVLFNQLADGASVFLDDASRKEEKEIINIWLENYSELSHEYIKTERGCSVLKVNRV